MGPITPLLPNYTPILFRASWGMRWPKRLNTLQVPGSLLQTHRLLMQNLTSSCLALQVSPGSGVFCSTGRRNLYEICKTFYQERFGLAKRGEFKIMAEQKSTMAYFDSWKKYCKAVMWKQSISGRKLKCQSKIYTVTTHFKSLRAIITFFSTKSNHFLEYLFFDK